MNDKVISAEELSEEQDDGVRSGTPSAMFLPARNYKFKSSGELHRLVVPLRGKFPDEEGHLFSGQEFDIAPSPGKLLFGDLLKVMFSLETYPDLKDNERFVIFSTETYYDKLVIVGEVITILE